MTIFIGADHRGFALKNKVIEYLQEKNIRVEDMGAYEYDANDDFPDFSQKVSQAVSQKPNECMGIVICGSGVGVSVAANRYRGIIAGIGFDEEQVSKARQHDHMNILALPSDYVPFEKAKLLIDTFIETEPNQGEKYTRRLQKIDSI